MNLDSLLHQYETGSLTRRELLGALALLFSVYPISIDRSMRCARCIRLRFPSVDPGDAA